jgi:hypothetical protein
MADFKFKNFPLYFTPKPQIMRKNIKFLSITVNLSHTEGFWFDVITNLRRKMESFEKSRNKGVQKTFRLTLERSLQHQKI